MKEICEKEGKITDLIFRSEESRYTVDSFFEFLSDSFRPVLGALLGASLFITFMSLMTQLEMPKGTTECIETGEWMRREHMQLLNDWRDMVVRDERKISTFYQKTADGEHGNHCGGHDYRGECKGENTGAHPINIAVSVISGCSIPYLFCTE